MSHQYFNEKCDLYAAARPSYPAELFDYLAHIVPGRHAVWDCATGSGQAAIKLAERFLRVEATDISHQQLAHAFSRPNIRYSIQPAEATEFDDASFDLVTVAQALHWFDHEAFWPEVHRVLKPGGVFAAWGYHLQKITPEIDAVVDKYLDKVILPWWPAQNRLLWDGYQDIHFPLQCVDTPRFYIHLQWTLDNLMDYYHTLSATRRMMAGEGDEFFSRARQELAKVWGAPDKAHPVAMEMCLRVGHTPERVLVGLDWVPGNRATVLETLRS